MKIQWKTSRWLQVVSFALHLPGTSIQNLRHKETNIQTNAAWEPELHPGKELKRQTSSSLWKLPLDFLSGVQASLPPWTFQPPLVLALILFTFGFRWSLPGFVFAEGAPGRTAVTDIDIKAWVRWIARVFIYFLSLGLFCGYMLKQHAIIKSVRHKFVPVRIHGDACQGV